MNTSREEPLIFPTFSNALEPLCVSGMRRAGACRLGSVKFSITMLMPYQVSITLPVPSDCVRQPRSPLPSLRPTMFGTLLDAVQKLYGLSSLPDGHLKTLATLDTGAVMVCTSGAGSRLQFTSIVA